MFKYLQKAYTALKNWFYVNAKELKVRKPKAKKRNEVFSHYYLSDLLKKMDCSFNDMNLLKKTDPESYRLFSRVGCSVMSSRVFTTREKPKWVDFQNLPTFGAISLPAEDVDDKDILYPRFVYFRKIEKPINVQPSNNNVLQVGLIYTCSKNSRPVYINYFLSVDQNGDCTLLKQLRSVKERVGKATFRRMVWVKPEIVADIANEQNKDINVFVTEILYCLLNTAFATESGLTVRVTKQKKTMVFSIDMERTPYFFDKRDKVVNENGNTKRIFHIVRTHKRVGKNGTSKFIKTHFRGLRKFKWHGYDVNITLGNKHTVKLSDIQSTAREYMKNDIPSDVIHEAVVGDIIAKKFNEA